jgi:hypothetical protein
MTDDTKTIPGLMFFPPGVETEVFYDAPGSLEEYERLTRREMARVEAEFGSTMASPPRRRQRKPNVDKLSEGEGRRRDQRRGRRRRDALRRDRHDGDDAEQSVGRWNRRMELELFAPTARTAQNTSPIFQNRFKQFPEYSEAQRAVVYQRLERMDQELDGHEFVAADRFTIADITALVAIDIGGRLAHVQIAPRLAHLTRWHARVSGRASAKA